MSALSWLTAPAVALAPPLLALLLSVLVLRRRGRVARLLAPGAVPTQPWWRTAAPVLAAALVGAALLAARASHGDVSPAERRRAGTVLVLDASNSMLVRDGAPDRMAVQRRFARTLLARLEGSPVALVVFAGRAYLLSPLTTDPAAVALYLDALSPRTVAQTGSSLADALRTAARALTRDGTTMPGEIVLVSDGDALEPRAAVLRAARAAAAKGAVISTVGVGTVAGGLVPDLDPATNRPRGYKRDLDGSLARSRLDAGLLREIASAGRGVSVPITPASADAAATALARRNAPATARTAGGDDAARLGALLTLLALLVLAADAAAGTVPAGKAER